MEYVQADSFEYAFLWIRLYLLPLGAYYLGIYIRWKAYPTAVASNLRNQFLIGIPVALIVVGTYIGIYEDSYKEHWNTFFVTLGILMFHGMTVSETAAKIFKQIRQQQPPSLPGI